MRDYLGISQSNLEWFLYSRRLVKIPNWTQFEINILKKFGAKKASELLDKSLNSCKIKLCRINMKNIAKSRMN